MDDSSFPNPQPADGLAPGPPVRQGGRPAVLDQAKRQRIVALVANGTSRRVAARFVGCAPSTITRTAARDPEFAAQLARAEQMPQIDLVRLMRIAARKERYWRAAAWLLERFNPEDFMLRPASVYTAEQVRQMVAQITEILSDGLPAENCRRALEKLEAMLHEVKEAARPILVDEASAQEPQGKEGKGETKR